MSKILVNRVVNSGLITVNLEEMFPKEEMINFDLKNYLFKELVLKEKDFRVALKLHDWSIYQDKIVLIYCSNNAIIPLWAYMLVTTHVQPFASDIYVGNQEAFLTSYYHNKLNLLPIENYINKRIVIKGCTNKPVPAGAYQDLTRKLLPVVKSIMFGEPCSTVPIYKKKKG
ncbi:MAG: DUF2480 family protein [Saprospiraceae bacterium]